MAYTIDIFQKVKSALIALANSISKGRQNKRRPEKHLGGTDNLSSQRNLKKGTTLKADCRVLCPNTSKEFTGTKDITLTGSPTSQTIQKDYLVCMLPTITQRVNCGSSGVTRSILDLPDTITTSTSRRRHQ